MSERVSVEPEAGDVEFATMGQSPAGAVLITVGARDGAALRDMQVSIEADPVSGDWILTLNDSGNHVPFVRQADRAGREWRVSWPQADR